MKLSHVNYHNNLKIYKKQKNSVYCNFNYEIAYYKTFSYKLHDC